MFPADRKHESITVEYDCRKKRSSKTFSDPFRAKAFYVSKFKGGKNPRIQRSDTMAKKTTATKKTTTAKKTTTKKATAKKSVAKKTAKKTTKKAAPKKKTTKKTKKKTAAKKTTETKKPQSGLTNCEVKVLKALVGTAVGKKELTRPQLSTKTGINGGWAKLLGAANKEGGGVQGGGLSSKKLIRISKHEGSRLLSMSITTAGVAALAKATK